MSTVCFIHDAVLIKSGQTGQVYSQGFHYEVWQRYLAVFDSITVCTRMTENHIPQGMQEASGTDVAFQPVNAYKRRSDLLLRLPSIYKQVAQAVDQSDAVIIRLPSKLGILGFLAARRTNTPILVELVGCPRDAYSNSGLLGRVVAPIAAFVTRNIMRKVPYSIYVTESFLQSRYPTSGRSIALSDVKLDTRRSLRTREKPTNRYRIGTIGPVNVRYKGHGSLVASLVKLPGATLEIVGGGDPSKLLSYAAQLGVDRQVKVLGRLKRHEIDDWLDSIDIYVHPSFTEGMPRALLEAMNRGLPALGSRVGGIPEVLNPEWLFSPGDRDEIADKITMVANREDFAEIGRRNFERTKDFDFSILTKRRNAFLKSFDEYVVRSRNSLVKPKEV